MRLKQQIEADIKLAMLAREKEELTALRSIKSAIMLAETEKGASAEISDEAEMKILTRAAKQRKDSAELYAKEGRPDLESIERNELEVIGRYLPKQLSQDELKSELESIIARIGASSAQDMGKVMGISTKELAGKADGKAISEMVRNLLN